MPDISLPSKLIFATHNENKTAEVRKLLPPQLRLFSLGDLGFYDEIPETGSTLEENARIKAYTIWMRTKISCFSDDTGLEVDALGGRPGVFSARFAGNSASSDENITKLLNEMSGAVSRKAWFRTIICLITKKGEFYFEGEIQGTIAHKKSGEMGFGYDSVFIPMGQEKSFAEFSLQEKNTVSHRAQAVHKLVDFLSDMD